MIACTDSRDMTTTTTTAACMMLDSLIWLLFYLRRKRLTVAIVKGQLVKYSGELHLKLNGFIDRSQMV